MDAARFHRIAVAVDGSSTAERAVAVAADLAKTYAAELLIVAVAPLPPVFTQPNQPFVPTAIPENPIPRYRELVDATVRSARTAGVKEVRGVCAEGVVVDEVLAQVRAQGSDLLVVGSRGLSTVQRLMLGSVSSALVTHAPCPVLVVRPTTPPPK
jgi:nucleotide-binding universal stress UspA family protein